MTRGTIVIFINDGIYKTAEYNGDMSPKGRGGEAYEYLKEVENLSDFARLARSINSYYRYEEGNEIYIAAEKGTEKYDALRNFNLGGYYKDWGSDYLYVKNLENEPICITCKGKDEKSIYINSGDIAVFHFGEYVEDVENQLPQKKLKPKAKEDIFVYLEHNDRDSILNAVVKIFTNKRDAERHLAERVEKVYGQSLNKLKEDPMYKNDTIQSDTVIIQNDEGDVSSFVIKFSQR